MIGSIIEDRSIIEGSDRSSKDRIDHRRIGSAIGRRDHSSVVSGPTAPFVAGAIGFVAARCAAGFAENPNQLRGLGDDWRRGLGRHAFAGDEVLDPRHRFVSFLECRADLRSELSMRARATGGAMIRRSGRRRSYQLIGAISRRSRRQQRRGECINLDRKRLQPRPKLIRCHATRNGKSRANAGRLHPAQVVATARVALQNLHYHPARFLAVLDEPDTGADSTIAYSSRLIAEPIRYLDNRSDRSMIDSSSIADHPSPIAAIKPDTAAARRPAARTPGARYAESALIRDLTPPDPARDSLPAGARSRAR